jgi:hypothetical protein
MFHNIIIGKETKALFVDEKSMDEIFEKMKWLLRCHYNLSPSCYGLSPVIYHHSTKAAL